MAVQFMCIASIMLGHQSQLIEHSITSTKVVSSILNALVRVMNTLSLRNLQISTMTSVGIKKRSKFCMYCEKQDQVYLVRHIRYIQHHDHLPI